LATRHSGRGASKGKRAKAGAPKPRGRPTLYSRKLADQICDRLAEGTPLSVICRDADMPAARTVRHWQRRHPELLPVILAARTEAAQTLADQCLLICENVHGNVERDRLRITTRMWLASKLGPKTFGDKLTADVTTTTRLFSTEELVARYRARHAQPNGHDDDSPRHAV
jgi:hypothetical protein